MKRFIFLSLTVLLLSQASFSAVKNTPEFGIATLPCVEGLKTEISVKSLPATKYGKGTEVWQIEAAAVNRSSETLKFKLVLSAYPRFAATHYLIPGVLYNGNEFVGKTILTDGRSFSLEMPSGWEKDGQPWIFAGDRSSIPACTISDNKNVAFSLFASDADHNSISGSSSLEKLSDGSFCHKIYWPMTEAPYSYCDKRKLSARYDEYIVLSPGESYKVTAYACKGRPLWENYGFATVFPVAWDLLEHRTPAQKSLKETIDLDLEFLKWCRRRDEEGYWFAGGIDDKMFSMGYMNINKSADGYTLEQYEKDFTLNKWKSNDVERHKRLGKGEYLYGRGASGIGFAAQSFQKSRVSIQYGLMRGDLECVEFGIADIRSWISVRQRPSGLFRRSVMGKPGRTFTDASEVGWAIGELSRTSAFLRSHKTELEELGVRNVEATADEFLAAADRVVAVVLKCRPECGALGSTWDYEKGELLSYAGDCGGYVLMGLVRYWKVTGNAEVRKAIDEAFNYYYKDIDRFECNGGAMDCSSVDREGIQPFMSAAVQMWQATGKKIYLERARKAGWYFLSWLYIQNPVYSPDKDLSVYNWRPAGATIVGTEHSALDEYGDLLISEFFALSDAPGYAFWKDAAALMWRNGTQGFADVDRKMWHAMERPVGGKNEAWFPTRWSKYRTGENRRGSLNDHLMGWGGTYRLASLLELSEKDLDWLESVSEPCASVCLKNAHGRASIDLRGANLRFWENSSCVGRLVLGPEGTSFSWPWIGSKGRREADGVLQYYDWKVESQTDDSVVLCLEDSEATRRVWPYAFRAQVKYTLGKTLKVEFTVKNTGDVAYSCTDMMQFALQTSHPRNCYVNNTGASKNAQNIAVKNGCLEFEDKDSAIAVRFADCGKVSSKVLADGCVSLGSGACFPQSAYTLNPGQTRTICAELEILR